MTLAVAVVQTVNPTCQLRPCLLYFQKSFLFYYLLGCWTISVPFLVLIRFVYENDFFASHPVGVRSIVISRSVYPSLFVFVFGHIFKNQMSKFHQIFCTLSVVVAGSSSDGIVIRYVYIMYKFPVLRMTLCFYIIERMGRIRNTVYVLSSSPDGGTGRSLPSSTASCFVFFLTFVLSCVNVFSFIDYLSSFETINIAEIANCIVSYWWDLCDDTTACILQMWCSVLQTMYIIWTSFEQ